MPMTTTGETRKRRRRTDSATSAETGIPAFTRLALAGPVLTRPIPTATSTTRGRGPAFLPPAGYAIFWATRAARRPVRQPLSHRTGRAPHGDDVHRPADRRHPRCQTRHAARLTRDRRTVTGRATAPDEPGHTRDPEAAHDRYVLAIEADTS